MKRIVAAAILLIAVATTGILLAPRTMTAEAARQGLAETLTAWTGREVRIEGEASLSLGLSVEIEVGRLAIAGPDRNFAAPLMTAEGAKATLRILPLFVGRTEVETVSLVSPRVVLRRDAAGTADWPMPEGAVGGLAGAAERGDVRLGSLSVTNGTLVYDDEASGRTVEVTGIGGTVAWPSARRALALDGRFTWRGADVSLDANLTDPVALMRGDDSRLRFNAASTPLTLRFSGAARGYDAYQLEGDLGAKAEDLAEAAIWLGLPAVPYRGAASLSGKVNWIGQTLSLADADVGFAGNRGDGAVTLDLAMPPTVRGTLAFGTLDLSGAAAALAAIVDDDSSLRAGGTIDRALSDLRTDIRLSADDVRIGEANGADAALALSSGDGRAHLTVGELQIAGGNARGDFSVERDGGGLSARATGAFDDIDIPTVGDWFAQPPVLDGTVGGRFDLEAAGPSPAALVAGASGNVAFSIADGSLAGFDLDRLLELRVGRRPYAFDGTIDFRSSTGTVSPTPGGFSVDDVVVETGDRRVTGDGDLSLSARTFSATMLVPPRDGGSSRPKTLVFSGDFDQPMVRVAAPPHSDLRPSDH